MGLIVMDVLFYFSTGNTVIHTITSSGSYELYIHLEDFDGKTAYAKYSTFNVEDFKSNFMLHISGYTGTAGISYILLFDIFTY